MYRSPCRNLTIEEVGSQWGMQAEVVFEEERANKEAGNGRMRKAW
jgi:hypothetical protein